MTIQARCHCRTTAEIAGEPVPARGPSSVCPKEREVRIPNQAPSPNHAREG